MVSSRSVALLPARGEPALSDRAYARKSNGDLVANRALGLNDPGLPHLHSQMRPWVISDFRAWLAAGHETAAVGNGHAEVLVRIDRGIVDPDFIMKMGTGRASAFTDVSDDIAAVHMLPGGHCEP